MTDKQSKIALAIVALFILGYLFVPVWQAYNRFSGASGYADRCRYGQEYLMQWHGLGLHAVAHSVNEEIEHECIMAS